MLQGRQSRRRIVGRDGRAVDVVLVVAAANATALFVAILVIVPSHVAFQVGVRRQEIVGIVVVRIRT